MKIRVYFKFHLHLRSEHSRRNIWKTKQIWWCNVVSHKCVTCLNILQHFMSWYSKTFYSYQIEVQWFSLSLYLHVPLKSWGKKPTLLREKSIIPIRDQNKTISSKPIILSRDKQKTSEYCELKSKQTNKQKSTIMVAPSQNLLCSFS